MILKSKNIVFNETMMYKDHFSKKVNADEQCTDLDEIIEDLVSNGKQKMRMCNSSSKNLKHL